MNATTREPVVTIASVVAAVAAAITLVTAFGIPVTEDQRLAVVGFVAVVAPLVSGVLGRRKVVPVAVLPEPDDEPTFVELVDDAVDDGGSFTLDDGRPSAEA